MAFQYIAVEGPIGVGKTSLAKRLAMRLDATTVLEERENPFLADFYGGRPGAAHGTVTAHLSANPRRNFVRILVGERVRVRLSPRDLTRGVIVARLGQG